jgi:predicted P-loop ATPase
MAIEQMEQVGVAWSIDVELYVRSALIPDYSPVLDFLGRCGSWDGKTDHIRDLARRVPTSFERWPDYFHSWVLAMVAQWLNLSSEFGNAVVPMLIGAQGTHKSTFCRLLLPPSLREYYIDDIKLDNAEQVERMLSRMLLVNIDEYNAKTDREQAKIKRVLTEKNVQTRKMRSDQYVLLPRMASFIATTNERQPLNDPTGSRRYLCVEVTGIIDTDTPINYQQLYAQALWELDHQQPYYFTKEEETAIEQHNRQYQNLSTTEILLATYFEPAERNKHHFMRAVDILAELQGHVTGADKPNMKQLTLALKAARYQYGANGSVRGWYVKRR